ncbi:MAG: ECF transporter S component [Tissierellales bacterium]|nr:ECF transporter S component [Tissierellales bacterium]MBN2828291.1 ECF transporter S component [Tissierellales bacterium]
MNHSKSKAIVLSGLLVSFGIIVPVFFHMFGGAGPIFLPMHLPVLIGGFMLSPFYAFLVGIITPFASSVLTGMPVLMPMAPIMMVELGFYGLSVALLKRVNLHDIVALVGAMILGRLAAGLMVAIMVNLVGIKFAPPIAYVTGAVIGGIPGIIIQLILIPSILIAIRKFKPELLRK